MSNMMQLYTVQFFHKLPYMFLVDQTVVVVVVVVFVFVVVFVACRSRGGV